MNMRKLYIMFLALASLLAASSCEKPFTTSIDLGVNTLRVNLPAAAQEFWFSVYSDGAWTVSMSAEDSWLATDTAGGSGNGTVHFTGSENVDEAARVARFDISGGSKGRSITVHVVQAGTSEKASDVELDIQ